MLSFFLTSFFFFNDTATTEIYTLSLHDALPISSTRTIASRSARAAPATSSGVSPFTRKPISRAAIWTGGGGGRSEEHTSELQSRSDLVCRLLLEKKKKLQLEPSNDCTRPTPVPE